MAQAASDSAISPDPGFGSLRPTFWRGVRRAGPSASSRRPLGQGCLIIGMMVAVAGRAGSPRLHSWRCGSRPHGSGYLHLTVQRSECSASPCSAGFFGRSPRWMCQRVIAASVPGGIQATCCPRSYWCMTSLLPNPRPIMGPSPPHRLSGFLMDPAFPTLRIGAGYSQPGLLQARHDPYSSCPWICSRSGQHRLRMAVMVRNVAGLNTSFLCWCDLALVVRHVVFSNCLRMWLRASTTLISRWRGCPRCSVASRPAS